ncbi:hypothetical protein C0Z18_19855 [Trinickia dabaoshanensis]|uniref:PhnB-like domain-containing protein n=1 Tax=Trinickia dabaoshanensis TaxID=564714 RepID=A0A2N7VKN3_9BURK|nr:VOC family protein [Trinickia dabaoshanensis]PMS17730.1 hypothetical protein C0Z18_19855 [Trinickia dabaoshanensis]
MRKITPFLWFQDQAEQAATFYTSTFERSRVVDVIYYPGLGPGGKRRVMSVTFELDGQTVIALNGGPSPQYPFSPAMSCSIHCRTQEEVDALWNKLGEDGEQLQCGWLRDRFGVTWHVVPAMVDEMLRDDDRERAERVMHAMTRMCKLEIDELRRAYEGVAG